MLPPGAVKLAIFILAIIIIDKFVGVSDMLIRLVKPGTKAPGTT